ncbi:MAG: hypothetical protein QI197_07135 [Candidatus Korarchaeota archaeon]|nr:hypothetical protein [Candidatus Korarchaeota archaeon]
MRPEEVWKEFIETRDIARAGRRIFRLARELREDVIGYLRPPEESASRIYRPRRLERGVIVQRTWRTPKRYPIRGEILDAFRWVEKKIRRMASSLNLSLITRWDLVSEIKKLKEKIIYLRRRGRGVVPLRELVNSSEELGPTLIALLFMEKGGEVELVQERPFDEIYVVLSNERT